MMKTFHFAAWSLTAIVAVGLALVMLGLITLSAVVLFVTAIALAPLEVVIRLVSLISPAADKWTSMQFVRFVAWLNRIRPGG